MDNKLTQVPQMILRLALGIGFILPCLDRLGFIGAPGTPGVNWGDWQHFTGYAHSLMPFLSEGLSDFFAMVATIGEIVCGIGLIFGFKTQWSAIGGGTITLCFAIAMTISQGILSPVKYPVWVFVGGAYLLACVERYAWSIDNLLNKNR